MEIGKLVIGGISIVGAAAFEAWLQNAGYSQSVMAFVAMLAAIVVGAELVGWRRAARFTARYRPMGPMLAFVIVGGLAALGWSALESFATQTAEDTMADDDDRLGQPANVTPDVSANRPAPSIQQQRSEGSNSPNIIGNNNTVNNTVVQGESSKSAMIASIVVETRLTAALRDGADLPPAVVPFEPVGDDSDAKVVGGAGEFALDYVSPTRFRQIDGNRVVVINTFAAGPSSPLLHQRIDTLSTLDQIVAHPVYVVHGPSIGELMQWEITIHVNGRGPWYYAYKLRGDVAPDGQVPTFRIPLRGLVEAVR